MTVRIYRAALVDVAALLRDSIGCLLIDLGRWLTDDDDHLADFGGDDD